MSWPVGPGSGRFQGFALGVGARVEAAVGVFDDGATA